MTWWKVTDFVCKPYQRSWVQESHIPRPTMLIRGLMSDGYRYDGASGMGKMTLYSFTYEGLGELIRADTPDEAWRKYDEKRRQERCTSWS